MKLRDIMLNPERMERATLRLVDKLWDDLTVPEQLAYYAHLDIGALDAYLYLYELNHTGRYGTFCPSCIEQRAVIIRRVVPDRGLCSCCEAKAARAIQINPAQLALELEYCYV